MDDPFDGLGDFEITGRAMFDLWVRHWSKIVRIHRLHGIHSGFNHYLSTPRFQSNIRT